MPVKLVPRRPPLRHPLTCERVRLVVSAQADGELVPRPSDLEAHVAQCGPCHHFAAACTGTSPELVDLVRTLRLRPARPTPAELTTLVMAATTRASDRAVTPTGPGRRRGLRPALSWAAAAVPASAFAVVLPVALSHAPAVVPSHVPTPCTIGLASRHARPAD